MPREARKKSESGIYHIMLRGINQQVIFEDMEDYKTFLETLKKYKTISGYQIFAYCLMSNHIHLLLKAGKEDLGLIIKRIAGSYAYWYNWKYYRRGHLFQDRFKSEPVEDDGYFLTVFRYIHQNPVKANIVKSIDEYEYSSYNEYVNENNELIDTEFAMSLVRREDFETFSKMQNEDKCLDCSEKDYRLNDHDARKIIQKISRCKNAVEFQLIAENQRDKYILKLKERGLSIRQISRLTGVSKGIIEKIYRQ